MTIGEFLLACVEWLYEFWPVRIVSAWEQGVRLRSGNPTKLLTSTNGWFDSGIHGFWPILGEIATEEVNARVVETSWQTLHTSDGHSVSFSLAARYKIRDLVKLYVGIHDHEDTIQNQLSAAAAQVIVELPLAALDEAFADAVASAARKRLSAWGVSLLEVQLFNRVEAVSLRLLNE